MSRKKIVIEFDPVHVARVLLALVFLWAGLSKLGDTHDFYLQIEAYRTGLPSGFLKFTAITLPWLEVLASLALFLRNWTLPASLLITGMLLLFVILTGVAALRGLEIACGCFDWRSFPLRIPSRWIETMESVGFAFWRNVGLLALSIWVTRETLEHHRENGAPELA